MKQSLETGRMAILIALLSFASIFCLGACGRLPRTYYSNSIRVDTASSPAKPGRMNVNTASAAELETLPGVGPMLAGRIIAYREEHGNFRRAEHLMMVRGISDRKFREMRSLIKVE